MSFVVCICVRNACASVRSSHGLNFALQLYEVIKVKFLWSGHDAVFFCPFVVRIECCWIAKFDFSMEGCDQDTYPEIMPSLPSNSSKSHATWWCAVQAP